MHPDVKVFVEWLIMGIVLLKMSILQPISDGWLHSSLLLPMSYGVLVTPSAIKHDIQNPSTHIPNAGAGKLTPTLSYYFQLSEN
jgi:hypothetical protein